MSLQDEYPWRESPAATLDERIQAATSDGIQQSPRLAGPLREAMLRWGEAVLTRQALLLVELGLSPDGPIGNPAWGVEVELAHRLAQGDSLESLQGLWELLPGIATGAAHAGWYVQARPDAEREALYAEKVALAFRDAILPPLLVARALAQDPALAAKLLPKLQLQHGWAESAWALVQLGHDPSVWVASLETLDDSNAAEATARVAWACAALGAWPAELPVDEAFGRAFVGCTAAVIWLAPAAEREFFSNPENKDRPPERGSPWLLTRRTFLRSVLHLARASQRLGSSAYDKWASEQGLSLPKGLSRVVSALGIELRLTDAERRAVMTLCWPQAAIDLGWLDEECWRELIAIQSRIWHYQHGTNEDGTTRNVDMFSTWLERQLFPAIWRSNSFRLHRWLIVPPQIHSLPPLLISPAHLPEWLFLYKRELPALAVDVAAQAWVTVSIWVRWRIKEPSGQRAMEEARDALLQNKGQEGWQLARALLIEQLSLNHVADALSGQESPTADLALLRYMNLTGDEWSAAIAKMQLFGRSLCSLLDVGAPVLDLARLLVKQAGQIQHPSQSLQADVQRLLQHTPQSLFLAGLFSTPEHLKVLAPETWPDGPWLPPLVGLDPQAAPGAWINLVRHLAMYSKDSIVRSVCLQALLKMEDHRAAN